MQGLLIKNNNGNVIVDSDFSHYHFLGKYSPSNTITDLPEILYGPGNQSYGPNENKDLNSLPDVGVLYEYLIPSNGVRPPLCFIKPVSATSSAPYIGIILTIKEGTSWKVSVFSSFQASGATPTIYAFCPINQITGWAPDDFGLVTKNRFGSVTFDSRRKPLVVTGGGVIKAPTQAHTGSTGSGWAASLNPNATDEVSYNGTGDVGASSLNGDTIFYCPSIAHACQEYTRGDNDSGVYDWKSYEWYRSDINWAFYRQGFRVVDGVLKSMYGTYAIGHVYNHTSDSSSILGAIAIGFLTFGAGFALALAAATASGAFTSAGLAAGLYLPYHNGARNNSVENNLVTSKASYYD